MLSFKVVDVFSELLFLGIVLRNESNHSIDQVSIIYVNLPLAFVLIYVLVASSERYVQIVQPIW